MGVLMNAAGAVLAADKPNIVFILIDDLGWRDLSCTGSRYYQTPHVDALAAGGMRFKRAYSTCMVCSPSRGSIQSGRYPARTKLSQVIPTSSPSVYTNEPIWLRYLRQTPASLARDNIQMSPARYHPMLMADNPGFARHLVEAGYHTGLFGKWHCGGTAAFSPKTFGWQESAGFRFHTYKSTEMWHTVDATRRRTLFNIDDAKDGQRLAEYLADRVDAFIRRNAAGPFCVMYTPYLVHTPIQGKANLVAKYREIHGDDQHNPTYAAMIQEMDGCVGRIMATLDELKLTDNTLVIFTSDNGGLAGEGGLDITSNYPLMGGKSFGFEAGVRVPLIMRWPGKIKPGSVCDTPTIGTDFFPTILDVAGLPQPPDESCDGVDLTPRMTGAGPIQPRALFWHFPHYTGYTGPVTYMIDEDNWKLIRYWNTQSGEYALYNMADDPGEQNDLAETNPQRVQAMTARMDAWLTQTQAELPEARPGYDANKPTHFDRQSITNLAEKFRRTQQRRWEAAHPDDAPSMP